MSIQIRNSNIQCVIDPSMKISLVKLKRVISDMS